MLRDSKHKEEARRKISEASRRRIISEETREKMSESHKGRKLSEETRKKLSDYHRGKSSGMKGKKHTSVTREKMSEARKRYYAEYPEARKKIGERRKGKKLLEGYCKKISEGKKKYFLEHPEAGRKHSEKIKVKWQDLEFREKMRKRRNGMQGRKHMEESKKKISESLTGKHRSEVSLRKWLHSNRIRPNIPEKRLNTLLQEILPGEYKLNVRAEVMILGGKIPDFVNVNGKKKVIELYGDYWHKGENLRERIDYFKSLGWDTLIVWENELEKVVELKKKLECFHIL